MIAASMNALVLSPTTAAAWKIESNRAARASSPSARAPGGGHRAAFG